MRSYAALQDENYDVGPLAVPRSYGLCTGYTVNFDGSLTPVGEPTDDPAYEPVALPTDAGSWTAATRDASSGDLTVSLTTQPYFPTPTLNWGTISHYILRNSSTGVIEAIKPLAQAQQIVAGQPVKVGSLTFRAVADPA